VDVRSLDLASTGFLSPSSGLGGVLDLYETLNSQNGEVETKGTAKLSNALLIAGGAALTETAAPKRCAARITTGLIRSTAN
jgi:hypothetical protein